MVKKLCVAPPERRPAGDDDCPSRDQFAAALRACCALSVRLRRDGAIAATAA
jgi:hypothetical protein